MTTQWKKAKNHKGKSNQVLYILSPGTYGSNPYKLIPLARDTIEDTHHSDNIKWDQVDDQGNLKMSKDLLPRMQLMTNISSHMKNP